MKRLPFVLFVIGAMFISFLNHLDDAGTFGHQHHLITIIIVNLVYAAFFGYIGMRLWMEEN